MKSLNLEYSVNMPVAEAYGHFADLRKFGELHPYMVEVKEIGANKFSIQEKLLLWGFLPMKPFYTAEVSEPEKGRTVLYTSNVKKGVDLKILFQFSENAEKTGTIIKESIEVYAGAITASLFLDLMKKAHQKAVENLMNVAKNKTKQ